MTKTTDILLNNTSNTLEVTGEKVRAAGWYGSKSGDHTVQISVANFEGRVGLEGSLAQDPKEDDWFPINLSGRNQWIEYPREPGENETSTIALTVRGNFLWLRGKMDRGNLDYEPVDQDDLNRLGTVTKMLLVR